MKLSQLRELVREVMKEEQDYQDLFKKMLDKTGKSIPDMSDEEKKAFFNAVDKAYKAKSEGKLKELVVPSHSHNYGDMPLFLELLWRSLHVGFPFILAGAGDIITKAKYMYNLWRKGKELDPKHVEKLADDFVKKIKNSKLEQGKKTYLMRYVNKLKKADSTDKKALINAEKMLRDIAKQHGISENKRVK